MTDYDAMLREVRELGMDYKWAKMFVKKLADDEDYFPTDNSEREWALMRGFYPGRVQLYGLTEDNYSEYIPDYNYFMLHPLNNHFLKWLDKTTLKYILNSNGCESTMPDYYVYIENDGSYTYLMETPQEVPKDENFLINLAKLKGVLAMKPNSGTSGGIGFIKFEWKNNSFYENNEAIDLVRVREIKESMRNYVVTEYIHQHDELSKIWTESECTLRVIMLKDAKVDKYAPSTWSCAVSFARFGTMISGGASNLSSGGVGVGFDFETGKYNDFSIIYRKFSPSNEWIFDRHPDTGYVWKGNNLPNWTEVKTKIHEICQHISSLDYLGLDIIITNDGMKLCEINSHPAMDYAQVMCGPVMAKEKSRNFFEKKGIYSYNRMDLYHAYVRSQK